MKKSSYPLLPMLLLILGLFVVGAAPAASLEEDDIEFMQKAAISGQFEIQANQAALQRLENTELKSFAGMAVRDHTQMATELKALAKTKNVALPSTIDDDYADKLSDLMDEESGKEFDAAFTELMKDSHESSVELFEDAAENAKDGDVRALAAKSLPTLNRHLEHVKLLDDLH